MSKFDLNRLNRVKGIIAKETLTYNPHSIKTISFKPLDLIEIYNLIDYYINNRERIDDSNK